MYSQETGLVAGRVVSDQGHLLSASITAVTTDTDVHIRSLMTNGDGSFSVELPAGLSSLIARADGYTSEQVEVNVRPGRANQRLNISLVPAAVLSGRVVDPAGKGIAGARVWVDYRGRGRTWTFAAEAGGELADAFGNFTIPAVAQGRPFVLHAEGEGWLLSSSQTMTLRNSELNGVLLLLSRRGATVSGRVLDASGLPIAGVPVHLRALPADTEFTADQRASMAFTRSMNRIGVSANDGFYHFEGVPAGKIVASSQVRGRRAAAEAETVTGRQAVLNLVLR
jgi:hypothetical protein